MIVLEQRNWMEQRTNQPLSHDAGKLLLFLIKRLSIPRESWVHTYCFLGQKKQLPKKKKERKDFLQQDMERVVEIVEMNLPCVVVGMGKLASECLLDNAPSILKKRAGTVWDTNSRFAKLGIERAWISYSTDAALYDPVLAVGISRVIGKAAREAGIEIQLNQDLKMFDWSNYL